MNLLRRILHKPFFIKLLHWEYWNMLVVYMPLYPLFLYYFIRSGFRFFFTAANPRIANGGFIMESKKEIYDLLPENTYPRTILIKAGTGSDAVLAELGNKKFEYPLITKPDIGMRGLAVKKIMSEDELKTVIPLYTIDFLIQEFVHYENEAGIFYYRYPSQSEGNISGITGKEFLTVTGDGKRTVMQLLQSNKRYLLQLKALQMRHDDKLNEILPEEQNFLLVPYGNHARGARFLDFSERADTALIKTINNLCEQIPEFYYGRLDIRYATWEALRQGKDFSIIELNGAGSEPAHIYDSNHSLLFAWKEILRHWMLLWRISRLNRKRGILCLGFNEGLKMFQANKVYVRKLGKVHEALLQL